MSDEAGVYVIDIDTHGTAKGFAHEARCDTTTTGVRWTLSGALAMALVGLVNRARVDARDESFGEAYRIMLWHHMQALRRKDEPLRERLFQAIEAMREVESAAVASWEARLPPIDVSIS